MCPQTKEHTRFAHEVLPASGQTEIFKRLLSTFGYFSLASLLRTRRLSNFEALRSCRAGNICTLALPLFYQRAHIHFRFIAQPHPLTLVTPTLEQHSPSTYHISTPIPRLAVKLDVQPLKPIPALTTYIILIELTSPGIFCGK